MSSTSKKAVKVTCAIILRDGKVLAALRSRQMTQSWKWEFPGGKIDEGESAESCIKREIQEELNVSIHIDLSLTPKVHHYPDKTIELIPFVCSILAGKVKVVEHEKVCWFTPDQLRSLNWAAADEPVLQEFLEKQVLSTNPT